MTHLKTQMAILLAIICFAFTSCKHTPAECQSCKALPPKGEVAVKINSVQYTIPYWEDTTTRSREYRYWPGRFIGNASNINDITSWLALPKVDKAATVVLYTSKFYASGEQMKREDVIGCQYYFVVNNILNHQFYFSHNGRMVLVPAFNGRSRGVSYNDRFDLYTIYFAQNNRSVFAFAVTDGEISYEIPELNEVKAAIQYRIRQDNLLLGKGTTASAPKCKIPCSDGDDACHDNAHLPPTCDKTHGPSDDPSTMDRDVSVNQGLETSQDADITFNLPLQYSFRDSFMAKTNFGRKYTDYYYHITALIYLDSNSFANHYCTQLI